MKLGEFKQAVANLPKEYDDCTVTINVNCPGSIGPTPMVEVKAIGPGFDWDAGRIMIFGNEELIPHKWAIKDKVFNYLKKLYERSDMNGRS